MIIIAGRIIVDREAAHEFIADTRATTKGAEAEDGCLFFSFSVEDVESGSTVFLERWRDEAALHAHHTSPQNIAWYGRWAEKIKVEVSKFDAVNERFYTD